MIVAPSATSRSIDIQVLDDSGLAVTGLLAATLPAISWTLAGNTAATAISLSDLAAITTAYSSGGVKERSGGFYRLDLPNTALTTAGTVKLIGDTTGKHVICEPIDVVTVGTSTLTPAAVATAVWQDTTAGDFTVASSIGKSLYTSGVAPGGSGGMFISGTNAGTLTVGAMTCTGEWTVSDGINVSCSTNNKDGFSITGKGTGNGINALSGTGATGHGIKALAQSTNGSGFAGGGTGTGSGIQGTGGATGIGIYGKGGGTSGPGIKGEAFAGNSNGISGVGFGSGAGLLTTGGSTGPGWQINGGSTSGAGINIGTTSGNAFEMAPTNGSALTITGQGAGKHAIVITGSTTGTDGIHVVTAGSGVDINLAGSGTISGTITNATNVVTLPTGFLAATFPVSVASVANQTTILNAVNGITTNTARSAPRVPDFLARPTSGSVAYTGDLYLFTLQGNLEDADASTVTVHARNAAGSSLDGGLTSTAMTRVSTGFYRLTYTVASTDTTQAVYFDFTWTIGSTAMKDGAATEVQDAENYSVLAAIKAKTDFLPSATAGAAGGVFIAGTNAATTITTGLTAHLIGTVDTVTNLTNAPTVGDLTAAMKASVTAAVPSVASIQSGLADQSTLMAVGAEVVALGSPLQAGSYTAPDNARIAAIEAQTNQFTFAAGGVNAQTTNAVDLTATYDAAKTAAQAGDAMALVVGAIESGSFTAGAITSAAFAVAAINDTIVVSVGTVTDDTDITAALTDLAALLARVDPIAAISAIKAVSDKLATMIEASGSDSTYTVDALKNAPSAAASTINIQDAST